MNPIKVVRLKDGRRVRKLVDRSLLRVVPEKGSLTTIRNYVQLLFFLVTLWSGVDFYFFVKGLGRGIANQRPPGVEGFLPISALMSLRYFSITGIINRIHPSGFFILIAVILVSTLLKKGFCSWICPIGYISESLHKLGEGIFRRAYLLPRWLDVPLRSLKYLMMAFFLVSVSTMSAVELDSFIRSDYNRIVDVKMFMFFADITIFSLAAVGLIILLSLIYENFWCRYLCPYGALLGLLSIASPLKIRRVDETCIKCNKCAQACPSFIPVDKLDVVTSAECTACYGCVEECPIKNTLIFSSSSHVKGLSQRNYGLLLLGIYFGIVLVAMMSGYWQNGIPGNEYVRLFQSIGSISHGF